ncbi:DEAD-box type RNA helicase [Podila humilis]|nr:DEAD-box type RNA helicase [Podila humilis]
MDNVIGGCVDCAETYYMSRREYLEELQAEHPKAIIDRFFDALLTWDCDRLSDRLRYLTSATSAPSLQYRRKICICELLLDPSLLLLEQYINQIMPPFAALLSVMLTNKRIKISSVLPGMWLLAVHENPVIQSWAVFVINLGSTEEKVNLEKWRSWEPFKRIWEQITTIALSCPQELSFPSTKNPNLVLRGIRSVVSSMDTAVLSEAITTDHWVLFQFQLFKWIMDRSGEKLPMVETCKLLFCMLSVQSSSFWNSNESTRVERIDDPMSLLRTIFTHFQILEDIKTTAIKEYQQPPQDNKSHSSIVFQEYISWISAFFKSLSGIFDQSTINTSIWKVIMELVGDRMKARVDNAGPMIIDKGTLDSMLEFDLLLLSKFLPLNEQAMESEVTSPRSNWLWLSKLCATGPRSIVHTGLPHHISTRITELAFEIAVSGKVLVLKLLRQKVETIWKNYGTAIVAIKAKSAVTLEEVHTELWLRAAQSAITVRDPSTLATLSSDDRRWLNEWQTDVVDVFAAAALLSKLETRSSYSSEVLAMCSAFNDAMEVIFRSNKILLHGITVQGDDWIKGLVNSANPRIITKLLRLWCSPDSETRTQALSIMSSAWQESTNQSCLRRAFEIGGEQSIQEVIGILADFRDRGCPGGATPPVLFQLLLDVVTVLFLNNTTDGEGGLYLQIFLDLTSSQEVARHLTLVKELWNSIWLSLNAAFEAGATTWHTQQARAETIKTMTILADVGLLIIGKIRYLERLLEFEKQDLDSGAQDVDLDMDIDVDIFSQMSLSQSGAKPKDTKETMPLEYLEAGLPRLAPWMYAQDLTLCSAALDLTCAILNLLADKGHSIQYTHNERLQSIAARDKNIRMLLTEAQCARLEDALGRHFSYFDEAGGYRALTVVSVAIDNEQDRQTEDLQVQDKQPQQVQQIQHAQQIQPSRQERAAMEPIEISDDDLGDLDASAFDDMDFDDDCTVTGTKTGTSVSSHYRAPSPPMKPALKPDFMRRLTGTAPVFQSKLNFTARPASSASSAATIARRLPATLSKFNVNITAKSAAKPAASKKVTSKLGQMRADHRKERGNIVEATKQARAASRYKQAVGKLPDRIVTSIKSGATSESESDEGSDDDGDNGFGSLVESEAKFLSMNNKETKTEPRKTKLLEVGSLVRTNVFDSMAIKRQAKLDEARRIQRLMPNLSGLHAQILQWEVSATGDRPPNGKEYAPIPSTFDSVESYVRTFEPLLVLECWEGFLSSKEEANQMSDSVTAMVQSRVSIDHFQDIHMNMSKESAGSLAIEDIVVVSDMLTKDVFTATGNAIRRKPFLAKVQSITRVKGVECEVVIRTCLKIEESSTLMAVIPNSRWNILKLMNLTPVHREYAALIALQHYDLCETILRPPKQIAQKPSQSVVQNIMDTYQVNQPQAQAIVGAIETPKGFTLVQGPPGTGKTKTILGLVGALLADGSRARSAPTVISSKSTDRPLQTGTVSRILVCAPSNAAIDEIVKRLKGGIRNSSGATFIPKIVRVGNLDSVNTEAKDVVLETLIAKELESVSTAKDEFKTGAQIISGLLEKMKHIGADIEKTRLDLVTAKDESSPTLISEAESKIRALRHAKWKVGQDLNVARSDQAENTQKRDQARKDARDKILGEADVICSTLSASGHDLLTNNHFSFETVIIDEAAQSVEVSSLIPLKYGCQRCILVGDPNQLPPTVKSQLASKFSYNQSLFVRIQDLAPSSVHLLSIQYRMHPDISAFPSREFYRSLLKDGPDMASKTFAGWHRNPIWSPYRFFDVHEGREKIGLSHSQHNPIEAEAAVELLEKLCNSNPSLNFYRRVGVISPYQQQVRTLKDQFARRFGSKILESVDFNSVDGFQGQEKDIIIFSCVRASASGRVGFLADVRRMNVALTRARQSLFILGHADTLRRESIWGDLVQDAEERGLFTKVHPTVFGPHSLRAMPLNLLEPRAGGDRRNNLYGKVSDYKSATVIETPMATANAADDFAYPSLPESTVVEDQPKNSRSFREANVSRKPGIEPDHLPSAGSGAISSKRKIEDRTWTRPEPYPVAKTEQPRPIREPISQPREAPLGPTPASSASSPTEEKRLEQREPIRPPSPKRVKKGPSLFLKSKPMAMKNTNSSASGVNSIPVRERLAAQVMPIRKSYPSGAGTRNGPVAPSKKSGPGPSLDDILNKMNK